MNEIINKSNKVMTVREVAEAMGVSLDTIKNCIRRIMPNKMQHGKTTYLDEKEVAFISKELKNNSQVLNQLTYEPASRVKNTTTELEVLSNALKDKESHTMTVKELAEELHVSKQTIRNIVQELFDPAKVLWQVVNGANTLLLTYEQATAIKLKLRTRNNLKDNSIVSQIGNDLEFFALLKKREEEQKILDEYRDKRIAELKQRAEIAENALNRIANGKGCYSISQTAKALKLPYGNITLFEKLRSTQILNQDNTPKQEQINNGNFKVIVKYINDKVGNKTVTLTTGKGLVYLAKKFNTEIDESIKADA